MKLRALVEKDAELMYEWMHDEEVVYWMLTDFSSMTMEDCNEFIVKANQNDRNLHYAVCNDEDEYLGTISLKNINERDKSAEYAVIFRKKALGTGAALWATEKIIDIAFNDLHLNRIYLDVLCDNKRAVRFYEKMGFIKEGIWRKHFFLKNKYRDVLWLSILNEEKSVILKNG